MCTPAGCPHHDCRISDRPPLTVQYGRCLPKAGPGYPLALGGPHGRTGGIPHPGILFGGSGLDIGVHLRGGQQQLCRKIGRRLHCFVQRLRKPSVASSRMARIISAGYSLHHSQGSGKRHRKVIENHDAPAFCPAVGAGSMLHITSGVGCGTGIPAETRLQQGRRQCVARSHGTGLLFTKLGHGLPVYLCFLFP